MQIDEEILKEKNWIDTGFEFVVSKIGGINQFELMDSLSKCGLIMMTATLLLICYNFDFSHL